MVTEKVLHQLEAEGYVQKGLNYGKARKGKSKASEPLFKLVADDRKLEQLFRPDLDLAHYVSSKSTSLST
jgi:ribosomal protein S19E (S16A)